MKLRKYFLENWLILTLFLLSTAFFIYQHTTGISWDFSVYVLNAKYLFSDGFYMEWYRSPLPSLFIGAFSIFGWSAAEYLYIIFVSALFFFACFKFCQKYNINKTIFYIFSLSVYTLLCGMSVGTELLSLSLLLLFLAYLFEVKSGVFFGLTFLARYTAAPFVLLLLFQKNWKKILFTLLIAGLVLAPWLIYNYTETGSVFTSIANSYALNVKERSYMESSFNFLHLLAVINILLPLFIYGVYKSFRLDRKNIKNIVIALLFILVLIAYIKTPFKTPRYLFSMIIPAAYFSAKAVEGLRYKMRIAYLVLGLNILALIIIFPYQHLFYPSAMFEDAANISDECMIKSNVWPILNYLGKPSQPYPYPAELMQEDIDDGYRIILFNDIGEPPYADNLTFLHTFPVLIDKEDYIILGNKTLCKPVEVVDETYLERVSDYVYRSRGTEFDADPCNYLFSEKLCSIFRQS